MSFIRLFITSWDESELFALLIVIALAGLVGFLLGHGL